MHQNIMRLHSKIGKLFLLERSNLFLGNNISFVLLK